MRSSALSRATWHKSSRSNGGAEGNCVEVAALPDQIALRDSKDPAGTVLAFTDVEWRAFLGSVRTDAFS